MKQITITIIGLLLFTFSCVQKHEKVDKKEIIEKTETRKKLLTDYKNSKLSSFYNDFTNDISDMTLVSTNSPGNITEVMFINKEKGHYIVELDAPIPKSDKAKVGQNWEFKHVENGVIRDIKFVAKN